MAPKIPGANVLSTLTGAEMVAVATNGPQSAVVSVQTIANLGSGGGAGEQTINTAITTVGAGTLTGAAIAGGLITRSGSTAAYTDTTDTAALIVAAIANAFVGQSFLLHIKNTVAFAQTLAAGAGVTLSGSSNIIPPNSAGLYLVTLTSLTAVTILHVETGPLSTGTLEVATALTTVGAGTITGAGIAGGVTARGGAQANTAFTDTTDTAVAIIAAQPNARIGQSWEWTYQNNTNANATLAAGAGASVSGITVVPGGTSARFLVTFTAAATITIVGIEQAAAPATTSGTFTANGAAAVTVTDSRVTAASAIIVTLKTVGGAVGAIPAIQTITPGTGFTIAGTAADTSVYNYMIIG
jgi:hypothetical protein